jgi:hypothetical protein
MRRRTSFLLLLAVAAALAVVAAGCGGGSSDADGAEVADVADESGGGEEQETTTTETAPEDPEEAMLAFTKCLREHGIDVPDPEFDDEGRGRMRITPGQGIDPDDPEFRAAQEECRPLLGSIRGQFDEEDRRRFQDAALEFARCMRGKGFDVPDPDFSGEGPGGRRGLRQFFGDVDPDDPEFRAAQEECKKAFEGLGGPLERDERRAGSG